MPDTLYATPGATFEAFLQGVPSTPTVRVRVVDTPSGSTVYGPSSTGVVENPAGSGLFYVALAAPLVVGTYAVQWDYNVATPVAADLLVVSGAVPASSIATGTDLCALDEVKTQANIDTSADDSEIADVIRRVSAEIERWCQRQLAPRSGSVTRRFEIDSHLVNLSPFDLRGDPTTVVLFPGTSSEQTLAASSFQARPIRGAAGSSDSVRVYLDLAVSNAVDLSASNDALYFGRGAIDVTGLWGLPSVPDDVRHAAIITAAAWLDKATSQYGGGFADDGARTTSPGPAGLAIPLDAKRALDPYRRFDSL